MPTALTYRSCHYGTHSPPSTPVATSPALSRSCHALLPCFFPAAPRRDPRATKNAIYYPAAVRVLLRLARSHGIPLLFVTNNVCNKLLKFQDAPEVAVKLGLQGLLRKVGDTWFSLPYLKGECGGVGAAGLALGMPVTVSQHTRAAGGPGQGRLSLKGWWAAALAVLRRPLHRRQVRAVRLGGVRGHAAVRPQARLHGTGAPGAVGGQGRSLSAGAAGHRCGRRSRAHMCMRCTSGRAE